VLQSNRGEAHSLPPAKGLKHVSTSPAKIAANIANSQASTGPRTAEGLAIASRNSTKHGLFSRADFIRPGEEPDYERDKSAILDSLAPVGPLECNLADEIHRAIWRLRRCGEVEGCLVDDLTAETTSETTDPTTIRDAVMTESAAKLQLSVDRARSLSHRLLHKSTAELRKLQTERFFRNEYLGSGKDISHLGLCDVRAVRKTVQQQELRDIDEAFGNPSPCPSPTPVPSEPSRAPAATPSPVGPFCKTEPPSCQNTESPAPQPASPSNGVAPFCNSEKTPPQTPRNAPCPCNSGMKYKRCCGTGAQPVLNRQAPAVLKAA